MALPFRRPLLLLLLPFGSNATASHHHDPATKTSERSGFHAGPIPSSPIHIEMEETAPQLEAVRSATAAPPPTPVTATWDLSFRAPPQLRAEELAFATDAPFLNHPAAATTTLLPNQGSSVAAARPSPPIQAGGAGLVVLDGEHGMHLLARVLTSLGYNEMASAAPLLANSPPLARWPGAITVFAAPDLSLQAYCPMCSRLHLLLEHIVLGYYSYAELAANPTVKIPSASIGFCLKVVSERGPLGIYYVKMYVNGVEVSHPELYNDGRYVVHGLHGFLRPLTDSSCLKGLHHQLTARPAATSATSSASVVCIMIREAIARLRDEGYGFMALAMRVRFAELENFANLTVFALDDQAIFVDGGHYYISAVRSHIVPGRRLARADLLRLPPGTILPTLTGKDQSLIITQSSGAETVQINGIFIKDADMFINSGIAIHAVCARFPVASGWPEDADGAASAVSNGDSSAPAPSLPHSSSSSGGGWIMMAASPGVIILAFTFNGCRQRWSKKLKKNIPLCDDCVIEPRREAQWTASCCGLQLCSVCLAEGYLRRHMLEAPEPCSKAGTLTPLDGSGAEVEEGFYASSQVYCNAEQLLDTSFLSDGAQINSDARRPQDRVLVKTFTSLSDVKSRRLPRRRRSVYLIRPLDREPLLLFTQRNAPMRRVFN